MAKKKMSDCPLSNHRNGQWYKKLRGKYHYFGTDKDAALKKWAEEKDYLLAGLTPPKRQPGQTTVTELANLFDDRCLQLVAAGEMAERSASDYKPTLKRFIQFIGEDACPENLTPLDFADIKERFAEPIPRTPLKRTKPDADGNKKTFGRVAVRRSPTTVAGDIRRVRAFLEWCHTSELIKQPRYGGNFDPITSKALKRHEAKQERKDLSASDLRAIIEASSVTFKPILLLAINGGIGNLDLAEMRLSQLPSLDAGEVWIDLPRGKTGTDRRFLLWPETLEAIQTYLAKRPSPAGRSNEDRLFLTRHGLSWLRVEGNDRKDAIAGAFTKFRGIAGVKRGTFYDLRRTFQTIAAETLDFPAVSFVMGHTAKQNDMAAKYTQHVSDERIKKVTLYVRKWLFGKNR